MTPHRVVAVVAVCLSVGAAALAPAVGCNGTGTTPVCDFPDGANNPESGCGELVEAAAEDAGLADGPLADSLVVDSHVGSADASDATVPDAADSGHAVTDSGDAGDSGEHDTGISDAHKDGPG